MNIDPPNRLSSISPRVAWLHCPRRVLAKALAVHAAYLARPRLAEGMTLPRVFAALAAIPARPLSAGFDGRLVQLSGRGNISHPNKFLAITSWRHCVQ